MLSDHVEFYRYSPSLDSISSPFPFELTLGASSAWSLAAPRPEILDLTKSARFLCFAMTSSFSAITGAIHDVWDVGSRNESNDPNPYLRLKTRRRTFFAFHIATVKRTPQWENTTTMNRSCPPPRPWPLEADSRVNFFPSLSSPCCSSSSCQ